jgi:hypothetical protein
MGATMAGDPQLTNPSNAPAGADFTPAAGSRLPGADDASSYIGTVP